MDRDIGVMVSQRGAANDILTAGATSGCLHAGCGWTTIGPAPPGRE